MMKVTDLPSGQRLVWPLQTFTKSGSVMADKELALLEINARSRAPASETPAMRNKKTVKAFRWNKRSSPRKAEIGLAVIFMERGHRLNVTKVMCLWGPQRLKLVF